MIPEQLNRQNAAFLMRNLHRFLSGAVFWTLCSLGQASILNVKDIVTGNGKHDSLAAADVIPTIANANGGRSFANATVSSTTVSSPNANFTSADVNRTVTATGVLPMTYIASVTDSTHAEMNRPAANNGSTLSVTLGGDTVQLPAGAATWTKQITISKSLQIIGAGIDLTNITLDATSSASGGNKLSGTTLIDVAIPAGAKTMMFRISGMTLRTQVGFNSGFIHVGTTDCKGYPYPSFRIDHIKMYGDPIDTNSYGNRYIHVNATYGLVDHCTFIGTTARTAGNVSADGDQSASMANTLHTPQQTPGDMNGLYIEDCTATFLTPGSGNGFWDTYYGNRMVVRYNTVTNNNGGGHGFDSGVRGVGPWEYFNNTFIETSGVTGNIPFGARSSYGVIFGNTITNLQPQTSSTGAISLFKITYYACHTPAGTNGNMDNNGRGGNPGAYYPNTPWGQLPYPGTHAPLTDGKDNVLSGQNPLDGNFKGPGDLDATLSRTVTDMLSDGSKTITSATANFNGQSPGIGDCAKYIFTGNGGPGAAIRIRRYISDGVITSFTHLESSTANFDQGDVGRDIGGGGSNIPHNVTIASVTDSQNCILSSNATNGTNLKVWIGGAFIAATPTATSATLNCQVPAGSGQSLTIGFFDQGYPALDQPGYGAFPSANNGNWPNVTTGYAVADYEKAQGIYIWGNIWTANDDPGPGASNFCDGYGEEAYIKKDRDIFYGSPTINSRFNGSSGVGVGTLANRPGSGLTPGVGYFATDQGVTNGDGSKSGVLYVATSPKTWTVKYVPLVHPHPMITGVVPPENLKIVH